ncbi:NAD(P)-dependent oxidoreductase [Streptomyces rishiriensis]|uniref:3-hydroxyisobutyrate dehydrogenase-like beta-hydroxyacid dehydrogenase n=1 Tax=Streptomyces rishiriensis TaxID=68264 RepID=A0ABU0NIG5_STRRH|nr:NAD(P)-dependent oxidoreductase [Streptomyces rishiriensis]MDQ0578909.1 3-hydroxyisobutyrate dehydrogenase-like beta-hydroxyacid dehydrogenase [Streptomyces rishiriensis]
MGHRDVGILHPGAMGARVAAQAVAAGAVVRWLPQGRSAASRERAAEYGLLSAANIRELAATCEIVLSVCPPAAALDVAGQVAAAGFHGVYVDANAVSPERMADISGVFEGGAVTVVDGGITGPPPREAGRTRLYLSGDDTAVAQVFALFDGTALTPVTLAGPIGRASALKLAFAAYNKISYALAAQACALADGHGVLDDLLDLARSLLPETPLAGTEHLAGAGPRAWRWEPEMREIARACRAVGAPSGFAEAAAETFARWEAHKDDPAVTGEQLIADLVQGTPSSTSGDGTGLPSR